jgi:geranylgeranyl diphosphate synthase, type II
MFTQDVYQQIYLERIQRVDSSIKNTLQKSAIPDEQKRLLLDAVSGGRRFRPLLVFLGCELCNSSWKEALDVAIALEFLHKASLLHDDLQDRDMFRRGKPSFWKEHGEALAIAVGDTLVAMSLMILSKSTHPNKAKLLESFMETFFDLSVGQCSDLLFEEQDFVTPEEIYDSIEKKTGSLTATALFVGGLCTNAPSNKLERLKIIGKELGVIFQIINDINNITGLDAHSKGEFGQDEKRQKKNFAQKYGTQIQSILSTSIKNIERELDTFPTSQAKNVVVQLLKEYDADWFWTDVN